MKDKNHRLPALSLDVVAMFAILNLPPPSAKARPSPIRAGSMPAAARPAETMISARENNHLEILTFDQN
jgi:hypothetical protein